MLDRLKAVADPEHSEAAVLAQRRVKGQQIKTHLMFSLHLCSTE